MNNPAYAMRSIALSGFRNYADAFVEFAPGFNVLHGMNAQGKTNVLEAVYMLSTTRLLRSSRDADAIQHSLHESTLEGVLEPHGTQIRLQLVRGSRKRAFVNGIALNRASDLLGRFPTVSVSATDLDIVRGEPSERRLFLDLELSQSFPAYFDALANYRRSLDHRNALLKTSRESYVDPSEFETWEDHLARFGARLRAQRIEFVEELNRVAEEVHLRIAPGERFEVDYERKDAATTQEEFAEVLRQERSRDVLRGSTSIGPHRDDLAISVDGADLRSFGSQGQQRSGAMTLKLSTLKLGSVHLGAIPALLLDDVFSDLDEGRRARLVEWVIESAGQALLTCTEANAAGPAILDRAKIFTVLRGSITST